MNTPGSNTHHHPSPDIRILQLDILRGVAVLGIYWINITVFALPYNVYLLPGLMGEATYANNLAWAFSEVFVDGTMRGLFSMLFGAGAMLYLDEPRLAGGGLAVVDRYYRRTLLLMLFGILHAYLLLWPYDVLYAYGLFGLFLFPLRKLSARTLIMTGLVLLMLGDLGINQPQAGKSPVYDKHLNLSHDRQAVGDEAHDNADDSVRDSITTQLENDIELYRSGYGRIFNNQYKDVIEQQSINIYNNHVFDIGGMMLIGMALFRWGVLSGRRPRAFYVKLALLCYVFGILIRGPDVYEALSKGLEMSRLFGREAANYNLGRLAMTLGHIGLIVFLSQLSFVTRFMRVLASIGRMALTNYIMQSVLSIFLFYGIGFGLYASYERYQLIFICLAIWLLQAAFSLFWLKHFHYGPLEWLWRSMIYGKLQKLVKD